MPIDETIIEEADLGKIKEVLRFLITQEKLRQQEVEALKVQIEGVDNYAKGYVDDQNFNAFKDKYGADLEPYDATFKVTENPDFDMVRQTYDTMKETRDENPDTFNEEEFIGQIKDLADQKVAEIKEVLGIPSDENISITETEDGTEIKTDADGDGTPETTVETVETETPSEEDPTEESEEDGISEEDKQNIDDAVDAYQPRH